MTDPNAPVVAAMPGLADCRVRKPTLASAAAQVSRDEFGHKGVVDASERALKCARRGRIIGGVRVTGHVDVRADSAVERKAGGGPAELAAGAAEISGVIERRTG